VPAVLPHVDDPYYREALSSAGNYFGPGYFLCIGLALALSVWFMLERRVALPDKLVSLGFAGVLILSAFVVPVGAALQQQPIKEAALLCRAQGLQPILWRINAPSFSVYRGQPTASRDPVPGDVVLTRAVRLPQLPNGAAYDVLYAKHGIVLIRMRA
jgi:hypothetical protein